jgi:hypothetical protein
MKTMMKLFVSAMILAVVALSVSAGTTTNYTGSETVYSAQALGKVYVVEGTWAPTTAAAGDVIKMIAVPTGMVVKTVGFAVLTTNSYDSATIGVGDTANTNRYITSLALNAASAAIGLTTNASGSTVSLLSVGNSIDIVTHTAVTGGTVRVRAELVDFSK